MGNAKLLSGFPQSSLHQVPIPRVHLATGEADLPAVTGQGQRPSGKQKTRGAIKVHKWHLKAVERNIGERLIIAFTHKEFLALVEKYG